MQSEKRCFCESLECYGTLHHHEVFFGRNRINSIKNDCWIWLCSKHHTQIHNDDSLNKKIKRQTQKKYESIYGHDKFMEIFRKNYL